MKLKATLKRITYSKHEVLGEFKLYEHNRLIFQCKTLELPWKDNKLRESCIPTGRYICSFRTTGAYANKAFHVRTINANEVKGRSDILIHVGNFYIDILGCIIVGKTFADINSRRTGGKDGILDVTASGLIMEQLLQVTAEQDFSLRIEGGQPHISEVPEKPVLPANQRYRNGEIVVPITTLNLRDTPAGSKLATLEQNTPAKIIGKEGHWVKVKIEGYIHSKYIDHA